MDVNGSAPATVLNQATVMVEHDTDLANNSATDATALVAVDTHLFLPLVNRD